MYKLRVVQSGKQYDYEPGASLLEILLAQNIFIDNPCNGKGVCGKCKVRIVSGEVGEVSSTELRFLKPEEVKSGVRLSCMVHPQCDLEIELMQKERKHEVLSKGYVPKFEKDLDIVKQIVNIHKPLLTDQTPFEDQIKEQLSDVEFPFSVLRGFCFKEGSYTAVIHREKDGKKVLMDLEEGDTTDSMYGIAIDIGTTTVVTALIDMLTGKELADSSMINAQKHFGLDVLTRITYEMEHPKEGVQALKEAIVASINEMIADVCGQTGVKKEQIYEVSVGANCTMMHMLLGVDALSIGKSPYAPMFVKAKDIEAEEIGIHASRGARLYCLPSVSSYIGADIVAGAYVCELHKADENVLFIDIGTNGEIVFSDHGRLLSCSCAAGPALEGMNISSGMRAAEGAIEDVEIKEDGVKLKIIGNADPIGVCGSGILALDTAEDVGIVDKYPYLGYMKADGTGTDKYYKWTGAESPYPQPYKNLKDGTIDQNGWYWKEEKGEKNTVYWDFVESSEGQQYVVTNFAQIIPANASGEYFGIYDICGKGAAFMGTTLVGITVSITNSVNVAVATLTVLFILGLFFFRIATKEDK